MLYFRKQLKLKGERVQGFYFPFPCKSLIFTTAAQITHPRAFAHTQVCIFKDKTLPILNAIHRST